MAKIYYQKKQLKTVVAGLITPIFLTLISSCSNDEEFNVVTDKVSVNSISEDEEILPLLINPNERRTRTFTREIIDETKFPLDENYDDYLYYNLKQLEKIPLTIKGKGTDDKTDYYLTFAGEGKAVYLSPRMSRNIKDNYFYISTPSFMVGVDHFIYSAQSNTFLTVGYRHGNEADKILYCTKQGEGNSYYMAGWNIVPAVESGYFSIRNQQYGDFTFIDDVPIRYNYALEVVNKDQIGYSKYAGRQQQKFFIQPVETFNVDYIEFDKKSAVIGKLSPKEIVSYGKNSTEERRPFTITSSYQAINESQFIEHGALKIKLEDKKLFYAPKIEAEHILTPLGTDPDKITQSDYDKTLHYKEGAQLMPVILNFDINGTAKPNSLIEVTSWLKCYVVSMDYIAYVSRKKDKETRKPLKIKGTWHGTIYTTKRDRPDVVKFFDLDDGEELLRTKHVKLNKTSLK